MVWVREFLEMAKVMKRERQPVFVRRCRNAVREQRDAATATRLEGQHIPRCWDVKQKIDAPLSASPRDERARDGRRDAMKAMLREEPHRRRSPARRNREHRDERALKPASTRRAAHALLDVKTRPLGRARGAGNLRLRGHRRREVLSLESRLRGAKTGGISGYFQSQIPGADEA